MKDLITDLIDMMEIIRLDCIKQWPLGPWNPIGVFLLSLKFLDKIGCIEVEIALFQ
jgi:hypothetical protein